MVVTLTDPFWRQTAQPAPPARSLEGDISCDVAIVGGGFTGLRAALRLAEDGTDVVVLEAGEVGHGASGRSGGQVNPMLPLKEPNDLRMAVGTRYFERMTEVALGSADALFDLARQYQIPCEARQQGWIRVNHCEAARRSAEAAASLWNAHGAAFEVLGADETARLTGTQGFASSILAPAGGAVQPLALVRGLARVAEAAGARIFSRARATALQRDGEKWTLTVAGHRISARSVILATNGYTDDLMPDLKRSVLPLYPIQMATDPLADDQIGPILREGHTISDTRRLIMYARREPGGQMVFGGIGFRKPWGGVGGFNWMQKDVARLFPTLKDVAWRYRWGGHIALTPERVPHLHEPGPGLLAGLGYNGRGVAMSLVMGRVLAERALGRSPEDLPFPVSSIRPFAFRKIQVWGAGLAMSWLRLRDQMEIG
ncbi:FAD-binding oxidoreductase [Thalassococcus sp. S3]|uniref:NAD(P)/FAD-dependent oxidoreductase n=1 Tax=Thalassococcus sp. S3 TaxID=2017482 RepID=UPI0010242181|nr:FAD-dependent oxidoreductase [Thalassococcus sp. S3]QBF33099.1 FAD-dependent oxidoreductase [Thalassococcus sp. S3]